MPYYTKEEIEEAKAVDLYTYLARSDPGELVHISGNEYCTRSHDSLKISNGKWHWWSRGIGGTSALDYLIKVRGCSFMEAMNLIQGKDVSKKSGDIRLSRSEKPKKKKLLLPEKCGTEFEVTEYLLRRGIHPGIISYCIKSGFLYESLPYHSCIFVGFDEAGTARYGAFRAAKSERIMGDVSGSDKRYAFRIGPLSDTVHVFESAIDLLSFATILKEKTGEWANERYLSLGGVNVSDAATTWRLPAALKKELEMNSELKRIDLHLDRDVPGRRAAEMIREMLIKEYEVRDEPPPSGKDYNEYLLMRKRQKRTRIMGGKQDVIYDER